MAVVNPLALQFFLGMDYKEKGSEKIVIVQLKEVIYGIRINSKSGSFLIVM